LVFQFQLISEEQYYRSYLFYLQIYYQNWPLFDTIFHKTLEKTMHIIPKVKYLSSKPCSFRQKYISWNSWQYLKQDFILNFFYLRGPTALDQNHLKFDCILTVSMVNITIIFLKKLLVTTHNRY
jgi:hypothetical protein